MKRSTDIRPENATPQPDRVSGREAMGVLGDLPPRPSREIRARGAVIAEGAVSGQPGGDRK